MATHDAVVTVGAGQSLEIHKVPTPTPQGDQIRVRVAWTASTPLDLHQADGGLLVNHPQILGDGVVGSVVEIGPDVTKYQVGDTVFGFQWRSREEKAHQEFVVASEFLFGKVPKNVSEQQAVTVPNNFVTAWHTLTKDFQFELPWPKPAGYTPIDHDQLILIWGASSSSGQYALQILRYYGYTNIITTASKAHHERLSRYGAARCFDYRDANVEREIVEFAASQPREGRGGAVVRVLDCIGSLSGSVEPISRIVQPGSNTTVAILLPVIVRDSKVGVPPVYEMDVLKAATWPSCVSVVGVRTHFYLDNEFLREKLQSEIMPAVLEQGIIEPNDYLEVTGETLLERAEAARTLLREKTVSGKRLVWRISD